MSEEAQFDSSLGGSQNLPYSLNLMRFTAARSREIEAMKLSLLSSTGTKLTFQKLPKHMRRRVMSHNAKRLPRRLREIHLNQLKKSGMPPKQKRPSRKYRRRPHNLMEEYLSRKRKHRWLETHIWHAKRFHMVEKWGFKLAQSPCDKAFRACYRASAKHCLIQDISYINCIEITGPIDVLKEKFKSLCEPGNGLSLCAKAYLNGNREGNTVIFKHNSHLKIPIGSIYFHWKPILKSENVILRTIWIWIHAAYYVETLNTLIDCLNVKPVAGKLSDDTFFYENKLLNVQLLEMKNRLNRFRLTGPLSHAILQKSMKTVETINESEWLTDSLKCKEFTSILANQCDYWKNIKNLSSPSELSPHIILSLIVNDPRFNLPKTRTKAISNVEFVSNIKLPEHSSAGPIWDKSIQLAVEQSFISNAKVSELRTELLVSGTDLQNTQMNRTVPIVLIQRPGIADRNLGYNSGWDIIIPSKWGQAFWCSFIMWGARAGGLRETESMLFECGQTHFLTPDTAAGVKEELNTTMLLKQRYFNLPPAKRINYTKYGIVSPFSCNWKCIIQDWKLQNEPVEEFSVLRNKEHLQKLQAILISGKYGKLNLSCSNNYIVPVRLNLQCKGSPKKYATICIPTLRDISVNKAPVESLHEDYNQIIRKQLRDAHKTLLKKLRRRRIKGKREGKLIQTDRNVLSEYTEKMRQLWLPQVTANIRRSCSREIIGFVTMGDFSFTQACGTAVGYIAMSAVPTLLSLEFKNKVLVRDTNSKQYRFATLEVIV